MSRLFTFYDARKTSALTNREAKAPNVRANPLSFLQKKRSTADFTVGNKKIKEIYIPDCKIILASFILYFQL